MCKWSVMGFILFYSLSASAQNDFMLLKKRNKTVMLFGKDSYIAFQLQNRQWVTGKITSVHNDSFYVRPEIVKYSIWGSDTAHYGVFGYAVSAVYAVPNKGVQIDYINGRFNITRSGGHVHWYWIKSGWVFRTGAAGYAALHIANGLIRENSRFSATDLGIAASVFLFGVLLHRHYKPTIKIGKKYHFKVVKVS